MSKPDHVFNFNCILLYRVLLEISGDSPRTEVSIRSARHPTLRLTLVHSYIVVESGDTWIGVIARVSDRVARLVGFSETDASLIDAFERLVTPCQCIASMYHILVNTSKTPDCVCESSLLRVTREHTALCKYCPWTGFATDSSGFRPLQARIALIQRDCLVPVTEALTSREWDKLCHVYRSMTCHLTSCHVPKQ
jgi:hypothetical protein